MDNVNTNELSDNTNENDWVLINGSTQQVKDTETVQLPETQEDLANKMSLKQMSNNGIEVIHEYIDSDTSNDVSVITESDVDNTYQNFLTTGENNKIHMCGSKDTTNKINHHNMYRYEDVVDQIILQNYELKYNIKVLNMISCLLLGCIIGIFVSYFLATDDMNLYRNRIKDLQTECHYIINTFKEINTTLNEIKARIPVENEFNKDYAWQFLDNINYSHKKNNKSTKEFFNNDPYILDNLQRSLNVLSLMNNAIYDSNSLLKNEINKTLNIVNNTKVLYETLILLNNSSQNMNVSDIMQFLQNAIGKIHHTSHSLLTDLVKKISKIMLNVRDKYDKMKNKLNEKLCHLKNILPDDNEFLKQLTMKSQLLSNYYKYCHSKNISMKLNGKISREQNIRINDTKKQTEKIDDAILHKKVKKRDIQTIDIETCYDTVINDYSQPTKIVGQCTDETLNNSFDKTTSKQNTKATSDYEKFIANKTKVNGPKANNHFKPNGSTKKDSNNDKPIEKKNMSQIKIKKYISKSDKSYYKPSFKNDPKEHDHYQMKSADWLFERSNEREKLRQASNVHSGKVHKASKLDIEIDASIRDMMRRFGQSIDKTMRLFEQKIEQVLERYIFSKKK